MIYIRPLLARLVGLFAAAIALPAEAHSSQGSVHSMVDGLAHPLGGADHLAAMMAVGIWAAVRGGGALCAWPTAFVAAMLAGGVFGRAGLTSPAIEPTILASVVILGLAIAATRRVSPLLGGLLVGTIGLFHGLAHGAEFDGGSGFAYYALGFGLSTVALHLAGLGIGRYARGLPWPRANAWVGGAMAAWGLALWVA